MTVFVFCMNELNTEQLLAVYRDENQTKGRIFYPDASPYEQLMQVEDDFLSYLREDFFRQKDAFYALLDDGESYCSAVRLEPYKDGMLLEGIATTPNKRRQGYATEMLKAALEIAREHNLSEVKVVCNERRIATRYSISNWRISFYSFAIMSTLSLASMPSKSFIMLPEESAMVIFSSVKPSTARKSNF